MVENKQVNPIPGLISGSGYWVYSLEGGVTIELIDE
jgi:hypothetical protein